LLANRSPLLERNLLIQVMRGYKSPPPPPTLPYKQSKLKTVAFVTIETLHACLTSDCKTKKICVIKKTSYLGSFSKLINS